MLAYIIKNSNFSVIDYYYYYVQNVWGNLERQNFYKIEQYLLQPKEQSWRVSGNQRHLTIASDERLRCMQTIPRRRSCRLSDQSPLHCFWTLWKNRIYEINSIIILRTSFLGNERKKELEGNVLEQGREEETARDEATEERVGELRRQVLQTPPLPPPLLDAVSAFTRRL